MKFVNVTIVGGIVRIEIAQICIMFIFYYCDLNADVFNESPTCHILSNYILYGGSLRRLQYETMGFIFLQFLDDTFGGGIHVSFFCCGRLFCP